jgi:predicted Zn-dependent peptidase
MQQYQKITLDNGLRILTVPQPGNVATTVLVLVETGSKYETKNISGIAHFLEHLCFKGTSNRPTAQKIAGELDGLGAAYNAFTSQEYTGYYAKVENHKAEKAIDLIGDLYLNPLLDAKELETEKGVVIEELNMYEDMPARKIYDLFMHLLYGDQPAGWDIGGDRDIIRKLTRENVLEFRTKHYLPQHTVIILAGGFDSEQVLPQVKNLFKEMPHAEKSQKLAVKESQNAPNVLLKEKKSDQTHIRLGFRAFDMFDQRRYVLTKFAKSLVRLTTSAPKPIFTPTTDLLPLQPE